MADEYETTGSKVYRALDYGGNVGWRTLTDALAGIPGVFESLADRKSGLSANIPFTDQRASDLIRQGSRALGTYPEVGPPQDQWENVAGLATRGATEGAMAAGVLGGIAARSGPALQGAIQRMIIDPHRARPFAMAASEIGAGIGAETARGLVADQTDNPVFQIGASLVGGVAGGVPALLRGMNPRATMARGSLHKADKEFLSRPTTTRDVVERARLFDSGHPLEDVHGATSEMFSPAWRKNGRILSNKTADESATHLDVARQHRLEGGGEAGFVDGRGNFLDRREFAKLNDDAYDAHSGKVNLRNPDPERAGGIGLNKFNNAENPMELQNLIKERAEVARLEAGPDAGGPQTWAKTQELADLVGMDADMMIHKQAAGEAWAPHEIKAGVDVLYDAGEAVLSAAKRVQGEKTPSARAALHQAIAKHGAVQDIVSELSTDRGRALNILAKAAGKGRTQADAYNRVIARGGGDKATDELADVIATMEHPAEIAGAARHVAKGQAATFGKKAIEAWMMGLLSGPQTHVVNMTSNAAFQAVVALGEDTAAAGIGALTRDPDRIRFRELAAGIVGSAEGVRRGFANAGRAWRTEKEGHALRLFDDPGSGTLEGIGGAISGRKGKLIRTPGRALQAEDELFKSIAFNRSLYQSGAREAIEAGIPMKEWNAYLKQFVANPSDSALKTARQHGREMTFTNELGPTGKKWQHAINSSVPTKAIVPFFRTPVNLYKQSIARNPLMAPFTKQFREEMAAGGRRRHRAIARLGTGTALGAWAITEALEGNMTGSTPIDAAERALWHTEGKKPYSIKMGDEWVSFARIEPFGSILGISADLTKAYQDGRLSDGDWIEASEILISAFTENLGNKTALQGSSQFFEAYSNPDRNLRRFMANYAGSAVPGLAAQIARAYDPWLRDETRGEFKVGNKILARFPGLREGLEHRYDLFGREESTGDPDRNVLGALLSPFYTSKAKDTPLSQIMGEAAAGVTPPDRVIDVPYGMLPKSYRKELKEDVRIELSNEDYAELARDTGRAAYERLSRPSKIQSMQRRLRQGGRKSVQEQIKSVFSDMSAKKRRELLKRFDKSGLIEERAKAVLDRQRGAESGQ